MPDLDVPVRSLGGERDVHGPVHPAPRHRGGDRLVERLLAVGEPGTADGLVLAVRHDDRQRRRARSLVLPLRDHLPLGLDREAPSQQAGEPERQVGAGPDLGERRDHLAALGPARNARPDPEAPVADEGRISDNLRRIGLRRCVPRGVLELRQVAGLEVARPPQAGNRHDVALGGVGVQRPIAVIDQAGAGALRSRRAVAPVQDRRCATRSALRTLHAVPADERSEGVDDPAELEPDAGLSGAHALVTGAGGDLGRAIAVALSRLGATVALVGRTAETLHETADHTPGPCHVLPTDLTSVEAIDALLVEVNERFAERLDVLVHCAGAYGQGPMELASVDELDDMYAANIRGPYQLTQQLLPHLRKQRGHVVFVNSTQAQAARGNVGQFAATQHALTAIADSLRAEVNRDGVRVLTLHVGRTATRRQEKIFSEEGWVYRPDLLLQPADVARALAGCVTLPRTAEVTSLTIRPAVKSY